MIDTLFTTRTHSLAHTLLRSKVGSGSEVVNAAVNCVHSLRQAKKILPLLMFVIWSNPACRLSSEHAVRDLV